MQLSGLQVSHDTRNSILLQSKLRSDFTVIYQHHPYCRTHRHILTVT